VLAARRRQQRSLLATLLLSQGVPMLLGGDEIGRTQGGNNNAYAQDNETSWYDWADADEDLLEVTRRLSELRRAHPVFRRRKWFQGRPIMGEQADDIEWFTPDGTTMSVDDWKVSYARSLGVFLNGDAISATDARGERIVDDSFYAIFNAFGEPLDFVLPEPSYAPRWEVVLDTAHDELDAVFPSEPIELKAGEAVTAGGRAVILLRATPAA
jgi:glycogen operon protein